MQSAVGFMTEDEDEDEDDGIVSGVEGGARGTASVAGLRVAPCLAGMVNVPSETMPGVGL